MRERHTHRRTLLKAFLLAERFERAWRPGLTFRVAVDRGEFARFVNDEELDPEDVHVPGGLWTLMQGHSDDAFREVFRLTRAEFAALSGRLAPWFSPPEKTRSRRRHSIDLYLAVLMVHVGHGVTMRLLGAMTSVGSLTVQLLVSMLSRQPPPRLREPR